MSAHAASLNASGDSGRVTTPPHPLLVQAIVQRAVQGILIVRSESGLQNGVHCAPAVPRRNGPVGPKPVALRLQRTRRGKVLDLVGSRPALTDPVVVDR